MRTYKHYDDGLPVSEWCTTTTLRLHDDGRFDCHESSTCYFANVGREASGQWQQQGDTIVLTIQQSDIYDFKAGEKITAVEQDGTLKLEGLMRLELEKP